MISICFGLFLEIFECDSSPCLNGGKCVEGSFGSGAGSGLDMSERAYTCICQPGFNGKNCENSKCYSPFLKTNIYTEYLILPTLFSV